MESTPFGRLSAVKSHEVTTLQQDVTTFKITFDRFVEDADKNTNTKFSNSFGQVFLEELPDFVDPLTSSGDEWDTSKMRETSDMQDADDTIGICTSQTTGHDDEFLGEDVTAEHSWDLPVSPSPVMQLNDQLYNQLFNVLQSHEPSLRQMFPLVSKHEQRLPQKLTDMLLDLGTVNLHHILSGDLRTVYTALHTLHGYYSRLEEEIGSSNTDSSIGQTTSEVKERCHLQIRVQNLQQELRSWSQRRLAMQQHCYGLEQENARLRKNAASSTAAAKQRHASEIAKLKAAMKHIAAQAKSLERRVRFMNKGKR